MYPYTTEGLRIKLQNTTTGDESNNEYSEHGLGLFLTTTIDIRLFHSSVETQETV